MTRSWIDEDLRYWTDRGVDWNRAYRLAYSDRELTEDLLFVIERRMQARGAATDAFDDLVGAAPAAVRAWLARRNLVADQTPLLAIAGPDSVERALNEARTSRPEWPLRSRPLSHAWTLAEVALLRDLCALGLEDIGRRTGHDTATTKRLHDVHRDSLARDTAYADRYGRIAHRALDVCHDGDHRNR